VTPGIQELMRQVERVRDVFRRDVLAGDVDAALAGCAASVTLVHLPMGTGGGDAAQVHRFLADDVVGHLPADLAHARLSRTVDRFRVVDEERVSFTHDRPVPWLLPGVAPTGRRAEVTAVSICTVQQYKVRSLRVRWDLATLLAGLGLPADAVAPVAGSVAGAEGPRSWW
jgi:carboxymethylenebutenolidase